MSEVQHQDDAQSVHGHVQELLQEEFTPVLFYKAQGKINTKYPMLQKEAFMLAIMTQYQKELLEKYGHRILCMDGTHKTNQYRFHLITLMVPDEYNEG